MEVDQVGGIEKATECATRIVSTLILFRVLVRVDNVEAAWEDQPSFCNHVARPVMVHLRMHFRFRSKPPVELVGASAQII